MTHGRRGRKRFEGPPEVARTGGDELSRRIEETDKGEELRPSRVSETEGEGRRLESLVVVGWLGIVLCGTFSELYLVLGPLSIESMIE